MTSKKGILCADHSARLAELATLKKGWLEGGGEAVHRSTIKRAGEVLTLLKDDPTRLYVYPSGDGDILIEADVHDGSFALVIPDPSHGTSMELTAHFKGVPDVEISIEDTALAGRIAKDLLKTMREVT